MAFIQRRPQLEPGYPDYGLPTDPDELQQLMEEYMGGDAGQSAAPMQFDPESQGIDFELEDFDESASRQPSAEDAPSDLATRAILDTYDRFGGDNRTRGQKIRNVIGDILTGFAAGAGAPTPGQALAAGAAGATRSAAGRESLRQHNLQSRLQSLIQGIKLDQQRSKDAAYGDMQRGRGRYYDARAGREAVLAEAAKAPWRLTSLGHLVDTKTGTFLAPPERKSEEQRRIDAFQATFPNTPLTPESYAQFILNQRPPTPPRPPAEPRPLTIDQQIAALLMKRGRMRVDPLDTASVTASMEIDDQLRTLRAERKTKLEEEATTRARAARDSRPPQQRSNLPQTKHADSIAINAHAGRLLEQHKDEEKAHTMAMTDQTIPSHLRTGVMAAIKRGMRAKPKAQSPAAANLTEAQRKAAELNKKLR